MIAEKETYALRDFLLEARQAYRDQGKAEIELNYLVEHCCGVENIVFAPQMLSVAQKTNLWQMVHWRLKQGYPLQWILGEMPFRELKLKSAPDCFITRPETELIVDYALDTLKSLLPTPKIRIIEYCSGSGAIALGLASALSREINTLTPGGIHLETGTQIEIYAVEKSLAALRVAVANFQKYVPRFAKQISLKLLWGDAFGTEFQVIPYREIVELAEVWPDFSVIESQMQRSGAWELPVEISDRRQASEDLAGTEEFHLILTNPPYVPAGEVEQKEALYDPKMALYGGGEDGLDFPQQLLELGYSKLIPGGVMIMEHAEKQAAALLNQSQKIGFRTGETLFDLSERPRFFRGKK